MSLSDDLRQQGNLLIEAANEIKLLRKLLDETKAIAMENDDLRLTVANLQSENAQLRELLTEN